MSNEEKQEQDPRSVEDIKGRFPETGWVVWSSAACLVIFLGGMVIASLAIVVLAVVVWVVLMVIGLVIKSFDARRVDTQKQQGFNALASTAEDLERLAATPAEQQDSPGV